MTDNQNKAKSPRCTAVYPRMAVVSAKATVSSTSKQFDKVFFSF